LASPFYLVTRIKIIGLNFWKFIKNTHPILNLNNKTIITNQDKGSIASIKDIIPEAALLHCSLHRCQNMIKKYGGGKGHGPLSCLWMYQLLVKCNLPGLIQFLGLKYEHQTSPAHVNYLNLIFDKQQFPAVRCAMAEMVCMYGKTTSSGVEAINHANDSIQRQTAINILNAALVLIKKESEQFEWSKSNAWKKEVWSKEKPLTPRGMTVIKDIFEKCDTLLF
jgi:hypothetical protein